jgi:two-component sensor histidine kinase
MSYEIEDISFPIEIAIPCGLVLTELFSNVCRHAFPEETFGRIAIRCGVDGDCYHLEVEDNGKGCEDTDVLLQGETLGFQLVKALTEQINGDMEVSSRGGLQIRVRFPFYASLVR